MTNAQVVRPRSPDQTHRRITRYEVVAYVAGQGPIRLGFTARPSFRSFLDLACQDWARDLLLPHVPEDALSAYTERLGLTFGSTVRIAKSGRTERECWFADNR